MKNAHLARLNKGAWKQGEGNATRFFGSDQKGKVHQLLQSSRRYWDRAHGSGGQHRSGGQHGSRGQRFMVSQR